jgi:CheY-like chemotaxis protein
MRVEILLVEDNPGDVLLTRDALKDTKLKNNVSVVSDGVEALEFLRKQGKYANAPRPHLILLDLNLPRMDGREVLEAIKNDPKLESIPVIMLTTSDAETDIAESYKLRANCYITKPTDLDQTVKVIKSIEEFWLTTAKLPKGSN